MKSQKSLARAQESDHENNDDRPSSENPNAQGPRMREINVQLAGFPNYPADGHDTYPDPYPRVQHGAVARGRRG